MAKAPEKIDVPQLLALDAMICGQVDLGSEDCDGVCFCGDAGAFVIKKNRKSPTLAHSEWFCSSIASACGVPQVGFSVVNHTDGSSCFGSLWQPGKIKDWWLLAQDGTINFAALADDLSRIYALDLFVHNIDRHMDNYMVVKDGLGHRVYSFDYSRAWLELAFPPQPIMVDSPVATIKNRDWFKENFGDYLNIGIANEVLTKISELKTDEITRIISSHPKDWLSKEQEDAIIESLLQKGVSDFSDL